MNENSCDLVCGVNQANSSTRTEALTKTNFYWQKCALLNTLAFLQGIVRSVLAAGFISNLGIVKDNFIQLGHGARLRAHQSSLFRTDSEWEQMEGKILVYAELRRYHFLGTKGPYHTSRISSITRVDIRSVLLFAKQLERLPVHNGLVGLQVMNAFSFVGSEDDVNVILQFRDLLRNAVDLACSDPAQVLDTMPEFRKKALDSKGKAARVLMAAAEVLKSNQKKRENSFILVFFCI